MKLFSNLPRRSYIILGTFMVLAALFGYYFWVYLPAREAFQISKRVRDLQQIAINFKEKDKVYRKTANSIYIKDSIKSIFDNCEDPDDRKALIEQLSAELNRTSGNPNLRFIDTTFKMANDIAYPYVIENTKTNIKTCGVELAATVDFFFAPFQKTRRFDDYLLFKGNALAYSTVDGELLQVSRESSDNSFNVDSLLKGAEKQKVKLKLDQLEEIPEVYEPGIKVQLSAAEYKLFSTNIQSSDNEVWTIYALVNAENFEADIKMIPYMVVIVIAVILLILIFALPLIKLSLISPIERLHRIDVVLSTSSFVICTSLLSLFLLFWASYRADLKNIESDLSALSDHINRDFEQELDSISSLMKEMEEVAYEQSPNHTFTNINIFEDEYKALHKKLNRYAFLRNLYWIDDKGTWKYQISTETSKSKAIEPKNFKERPYFYEIANNNGWHSDRISTQNTFYVQSITSWLNSEKLAVVSVPSKSDHIDLKDKTIDNIKVLAASIRLHALMDPLLPPAFSFCVINEEGDVLFHSDKEKNLQENLLADVDDHRGVRSALIGKNNIYANVYAGENSQMIYISPLKHTPWMLVTAYDKAYIESPYLQLISFCVICVLVIGGIAFFQLYLISLLDHKPSKLKKQTFYYDWLWPVKGKRERYFSIMIYNLILATALGLYHLYYELTVLQVLSSFLYAVLFSNSCGWLVLEDDSRQKRYKSRIILGATIAVCLIIYVMTSLITLGWGENFFVLLLVVVISFILSIPLRSKNLQNLPWPPVKTGFRNAYWGMLFTYLFVSSILPAIFLYSAAYVQELEIWAKYELYEISKARESRNVALHTLYKHKTVVNEENTQPESIYQLAIHEGNYYNTLNFKACDCRSSIKVTKLRPRWNSLLHRSRPFFTNMFVASNGFVFSKGGDEWKTDLCDTHGIRMHYHSVNQTPDDGVVLATVSRGLNWPYIWSELKENTFWLAVIWLSFLVAIFYVVRFATNKFFAMELFNNLQTMEIDDAYLDNYFSTNLKEDGHKHLFVVALPFAGTHQLYQKNHLQVFDVPHLLDEKECAKILKIKNSQVVLEHFSYVIEDTLANKQILDIVERLLRNQNNIIIVSRLSPTQIIDQYEERITKLEDVGQKAELEIQMSKWKDILAGFVKVFYSLLHENTLHQKYAENFSIKELLSYEFRVNEEYFRRIKQAFTQKWEPGNIVLMPSLAVVEQEKESKPLQHNDVKEEIILKIQSMAQPFYFSLWNTCSKEEKYLLYDLAMDGFVNTQNERGLKKLLEKGLIYYHESLQVMNESFRNFILSTIKESESLAMEKELRRSGTWSLYSSVFLILLISLIVFVSLSQKEIISQFVALMAGLATAIPYLLRFSGFFSSISGNSKLNNSA
ncbi:hypothetical protein OKW21_003894 [Catalinimonas alkaloidigena]|uniref:hypothetical protein n=1 Tax=Catalinimonas alkaloidigena TaxID=1075417 RepID=UPI002406D4AD|nr:hypothetical protein [Catalinimonas alkaloidigena]MDF9798631.1 hypothetical protein [Catalinimonas alkaloidigena]